MILTLRKTIPSTSHNAPYSEELGEHWPAGQEFKLLDQRRQRCLHKHFHVPTGRTCVEQIGGEEVLVSIPNEQFPDLFGIEVPADLLK